MRESTDWIKSPLHWIKEHQEISALVFLMVLGVSMPILKVIGESSKRSSGMVQEKKEPPSRLTLLKGSISRCLTSLELEESKRISAENMRELAEIINTREGKYLPLEEVAVLEALIKKFSDQGEIWEVMPLLTGMQIGLLRITPPEKSRELFEKFVLPSCKKSIKSFCLKSTPKQIESLLKEMQKLREAEVIAQIIPPRAGVFSLPFIEELRNRKPEEIGEDFPCPETYAGILTREEAESPEREIIALQRISRACLCWDREEYSLRKNR